MITTRTAERLIRAAYDFEELAARLRGEGFALEGNSVRDVSSTLGKIGRGLLDKLKQEAPR